jgi:hypothetical protein
LPRPSSVPVFPNPFSPPPVAAKTAAPSPPIAAKTASSPPPAAVETGTLSEPVSLSSSAPLERDYCPASPAQREAHIHQSTCDLFVLLKGRGSCLHTMQTWLPFGSGIQAPLKIT